MFSNDFPKTKNNFELQNNSVVTAPFEKNPRFFYEKFSILSRNILEIFVVFRVLRDHVEIATGR